METKFKSTLRNSCQSCGVFGAVAIVLQFGALPGYAQPGEYLYTGFKKTITLNPGIYNITAYGAQGGGCYQSAGGLGAEMGGEFLFTTATTLTLLVGGAGGNGQLGTGGGGGGGSFIVNGTTPLVVAGGGGGSGAAGSNPGNTGTGGGSGGYAGGPGGSNGGGGEGSGFTGGGGGFSGDGWGFNYYFNNGLSFLHGGPGGGNGGFGGGGGGSYTQAGGGGGGYSGGGGGGFSRFNEDYGLGGGGGGSFIDASAIMILTEVSGVPSPDGSPHGEIIITLVPEPTTLALAGLSGLGLLLLRRQRARGVASQNLSPRHLLLFMR